MSRFSGLLQRTATRLDLPQPVKSRVLLEMAADLEDMFAAYRERGLGEEEATQRVEEKFAVSDETLAELTRLHRSAFHRGAEGLSEQASTAWEKLMLILVLLFVFASTGGLLLLPGFFSDASGFVWPGVALGAAALGLFLFKAPQLFLGKSQELRDLRRGLPSLLLIACAALFNGFFGSILGLHVAMFRSARDFEQVGTHFMNWVAGNTATLILSLLVAILAALLWFVLVSKVKRIELREATLLLEENR